LYADWEKATSSGSERKKKRYEEFFPALSAGMAKLNSYYQRSADSDAHIMAMGTLLDTALIRLANHRPAVLDPSKKMSYFRKHWPSNLVSDVEDTVQTRVRPLLTL
jgi:hypothetical protein